MNTIQNTKQSWVAPKLECVELEETEGGVVNNPEDASGFMIDS